MSRGLTVLCDAGSSVNLFRAKSSKAEWREERPERSEYSRTVLLAETCTSLAAPEEQSERSEAVAVVVWRMAHTE